MNIVDLGFPVVGTWVPRDHGYLLYSALCTALPALHGAPWLGVHPLGGVPDGDGTLRLRKEAELRLRLPGERVRDALALAGRTLHVGEARLQIGAPRVYALVPAPSLDARLVVIKVTNVPRRLHGELGRETLDTQALEASVRAELGRQLARLGVDGRLSLRGRQRMTVGGRRIVGYSVRVEELTRRIPSPPRPRRWSSPFRCLRALSTTTRTRRSPRPTGRHRSDAFGR